MIATVLTGVGVLIGVWRLVDGGLVGGAFGDGTHVATGAGAGLRMTRHLGLDVELTHLSHGSRGEVAAPRFGGMSVFSGMFRGWRRLRRLSAFRRRRRLSTSRFREQT